MAGDTWVAWREFANAVYEADSLRDEATMAVVNAGSARAATDAAGALDEEER